MYFENQRNLSKSSWIDDFTFCGVTFLKDSLKQFREKAAVGFQSTFVNPFFLLFSLNGFCLTLGTSTHTNAAEWDQRAIKIVLKQSTVDYRLPFIESSCKVKNNKSWTSSCSELSNKTHSIFIKIVLKQVTVAYRLPIIESSLESLKTFNSELTIQKIQLRKKSTNKKFN